MSTDSIPAIPGRSTVHYVCDGCGKPAEPVPVKDDVARGYWQAQPPTGWAYVEFAGTFGTFERILCPGCFAPFIRESPEPKKSNNPPETT